MRSANRRGYKPKKAIVPRSCQPAPPQGSYDRRFKGHRAAAWPSQHPGIAKTRTRRDINGPEVGEDAVK